MIERSEAVAPRNRMHESCSYGSVGGLGACRPSLPGNGFDHEKLDVQEMVLVLGESGAGTGTGT